MTNICIKHELEKEFEKGTPRYDIWRKYPNVKHDTIRQYHWNWKNRKNRKKKSYEDPLSGLYQLADDLRKIHSTNNTTKSKPVKTIPNKVEPTTNNKNTKVNTNIYPEEKKAVREWKTVEKRERFNPFE